MSDFLVPDQTDRTWLVTGANSGLGLETSRMLAAAGAHVVMTVRDAAKGRAAAEEVRGGLGGRGSVEVAALDLADLASVRALAEGWEHPLHGVVANAGIMMVPQGRTVDGFELQLGTNHLGHFALVNLLLPHVADRVVSVSSALHKGPPLDFDDLFLERSYSPGRAYQQSKLANLLFTAELQRRLGASGSPVRATAAHPGYAATNLQSHHAVPLMNTLMAVGNRVVATSAEEGARPSVMAATYDLVGGTYVGPSRLGGLRGAPAPASRSLEAADDGAARRLWDVSEELTGVGWAL